MQTVRMDNSRISKNQSERPDLSLANFPIPRHLINKRVILYSQLSWKRKLTTVKNLKADVSSFSPLSERLEELLVV